MGRMRRENAKLTPEQRDAAVEARLGIGGADWKSPGAELVGYHASGVDSILEALREAPVTADDVFVDLGQCRQPGHDAPRAVRGQRDEQR